MEKMFAREDFVDSLVQMLFPTQNSIRVKNPIAELVSRSKEPHLRSLSDIKSLSVRRRRRRKLNYFEYKPYNIAS